MPKVDLALVVPCFNESETISHFVEKVVPVLQKLNINSEIFFIDDGSDDNTWEILCELKSQPGIKFSCIKFDRNYGQMAALEAGIKASDSDYVLTIDVDLQHPVRYIEAMWLQREEYPVVAMRQSERHDPFFKRQLSKTFYVILKKVTGYQIVGGVSDFRLMSRKTVHRIIPLLRYGNVIRFLLPQLGIEQKILDYQVDPRIAGESKYSLKKMSLLAKNSFISTSNRLLTFSIYLAGICIAFASVIFSYVVYVYFTDNAILGWASILGSVLVLFSGTFTILAILGLYIGRAIELLKDLPNFYVSEEKKDE
jgi:glycosyltransferase involved in cell wall biosynthesis